MRRILIVGATSAIAEACARRWAAQGHALALAGRNAAQLASIADDLRVRGAAQAEVAAFDAARHDGYAALFDDVQARLGGLDTLLVAHGSLPDQTRAERDAAYAAEQIAVNALSAVALLALAAERFQAQRHGAIAVISSVAGDRGRQSNYVYGSAKAMVSTYASGLRQRLAKHGVHVLTVKPGFVDTPMTAHLPKGALWAKPERVAADIVRALERRQAVLYTPGFWRPVMSVIRHLPERVFNRLSL